MYKMNMYIINSDESDADEFEKLTSVDGTPDEFENSSNKQMTKAAAQEYVDIKDIHENEEYENLVGKLCQYSRYGQGFLPTGSTIRILKPGVYDVGVGQAGEFFLPHSIVTDRLLRLPDSKSDAVITEIENFWPLKQRFKDFGFIHKRGILLWGPPGSGKTATVSFIMNQMVAGGGLVILGDSCTPTNLANALAKLREIEPERPVVVVLEDIDTIINNYGESDVLSLLDGESSIDNVVFIATTNYPEELDGRVVNRPSRFDKVIKIGMPNVEARKVYLKSRGLETIIDVDAWAEATEGFSIAHIKELIVGVCCYGNEFKAEIGRLKRMFIRPSSSDGEGRLGFQSDFEESDDE